MGLLKSINKKKKTPVDIEVEKSTFEKIVFNELTDDEDSYLASLADKMIDGCPLIINLATLDIDQANKVIAFLSGVTYAINGEVLYIDEKVFMFANSAVYNDGTMEDFLKEIVK